MTRVKKAKSPAARTIEEVELEEAIAFAETLDIATFCDGFLTHLINIGPRCLKNPEKGRALIGGEEFDWLVKLSGMIWAAEKGRFPSTEAEKNDAMERLYIDAMMEVMVRDGELVRKGKWTCRTRGKCAYSATGKARKKPFDGEQEAS